MEFPKRLFPVVARLSAVDTTASGNDRELRRSHLPANGEDAVAEIALRFRP